MTIKKMAWVASGIAGLAIPASDLVEVSSSSRQSMGLPHAYLPLLTHNTDETAIDEHLVSNVQPELSDIQPEFASHTVPFAQLVRQTSIQESFDAFEGHEAIATLDPHSISGLPAGISQRPDRDVTYLSAAAPHILPPENEAFWRCPASFPQPMPIEAALYPIRMHGCVVAYAAHPATAKRVSQTLNRLLQTPNTNWDALMPSLSGEKANIQLGDQHLLSLTNDTAEQFDQHPHRLVTDWVNNIRAVAGASTLPLAQAQKHMYAVTETDYATQGAASWYGPYFHGRLTANGETYDQYELTAAHRTLPLGTFVQVTNRINGTSVVVRINDRGPYIDEDYRIIDLSYRAAQILQAADPGIVPIDLVILEKAPEMAINPIAAYQAIAFES